MAKLLRNTKRRISRMQRGQVLVLVAASAVALIAIIGLVMDVGLVFVGNARLRRATDAAALAAALQYRENYQQSYLVNTATEFLEVNGVTIDSNNPPTVDTCVTLPSLCYDDAQDKIILRKLVKVTVWAKVPLAFLPVIGINSVNISATATSETASLDLVLVIDTSESMTFDALKPGDLHYDPNVPWDLRDPSVCNDDQKSINAINGDNSLSAAQKASIITDIQTDGLPGECHPFEEVKDSAVKFVDGLLFYPYDRVAVVTFDKAAYYNLEFQQDCTDPNGCSTDEIKANIEDAIKNLTVYEGAGICDNGQPCRPYCTQAIINAGFCDSQPADVHNFLDPAVHPDAVYKGNFDCGEGWYFDPSNPLDPSHCTTTDIGDGLLLAGNEYSPYTPLGGGRQGALWVVVLLTDGSANAGTDQSGDPVCPSSTWNPQINPLCRDSSSDTRHCAVGATRTRCIQTGNGLPALPDNPSGVYKAGIWDPLDYDADDYARDMADFVGIDQSALLFTIGLGNQVNLPTSDPAGERLLVYASESVGNGLYFFAPTPTKLADIFKKIGDNIAIRLAH